MGEQVRRRLQAVSCTCQRRRITRWQIFLCSDFSRRSSQDVVQASRCTVRLTNGTNSKNNPAVDRFGKSARKGAIAIGLCWSAISTLASHISPEGSSKTAARLRLAATFFVGTHRCWCLLASHKSTLPVTVAAEKAPVHSMSAGIGRLFEYIDLPSLMRLWI